MNEPIIRDDSFKADLINAIFLRPVWRKPYPKDPEPVVEPEHPDYPKGSLVRIHVYFRGNLDGAVGIVDKYYPNASSGPAISVLVAGDEFKGKAYNFNPHELTLIPREDKL